MANRTHRIDDPDEAKARAKLDQLIDYLSAATQDQAGNGQPGSEETFRQAIALAEAARDSIPSVQTDPKKLQRAVELATAIVKLIGELFNIAFYVFPRITCSHGCSRFHDAARRGHQAAAASLWLIAA